MPGTEAVLHPKIKRISQQAKPKNVLLVGDTGTGKTTVAATAPRPLFLNVESGLDSVGDRDDLEYWDIETLNDLYEAHSFFTGTVHPEFDSW